MVDSAFSTEAFLQTSVEGSLDTKITPCPQGEFLAIAGKPEVRAAEIKRGDRAGEPIYFLDITWDIQDDSIKEELGRDKVTVRQSLILDIKNDTLDMSKGKNIGLGRLREALGQNTAGQPWSPAMLEGQLAKVVVSHRMDGDDVYAEIKQTRAPHG